MQYTSLKRAQVNIISTPHSTNNSTQSKVHSHKQLIGGLVVRWLHLTQCLSVHCEGAAGGVVHEETLDLRQETRWDPRYFSTSDVGVLRQSCAHTQGLGLTRGDVRVHPWNIRKLPLLLKDNGHLPTLHS